MKSSVLICCTAVLLGSLASAGADERDTCTSDFSTPDHAIESCNRVLDAVSTKDKDTAIFFLARGFGYTRKANFVLPARQEYDDTRKAIFAKALQDYDEALRLDPAMEAIYHFRGQAKYNLKDYDGAIRDYNEAIKFEPKSAGAYYDRAIAYDDKGDILNALPDYNTAIRVDPKNVMALTRRGLYYEARGDYAKALADLAVAQKIDPIFEDFESDMKRIKQKRASPAKK